LLLLGCAQSDDLEVVTIGGKDLGQGLPGSVDIGLANPDTGPIFEPSTPDPGSLDKGGGPPVGGDATTQPDVTEPLPPEAIADLNLRWDQTMSGPDPTTGGKVFRLAFTFTSQAYGGTEWEHGATLYIPVLEGGAAPDTLAILQQGSSTTAVGDKEEDFRTKMGAQTANLLGVAVMVVGNMPPEGLKIEGAPASVKAQVPDCFGAELDAQTFVACGVEIVARAKDITFDPFTAMRRVWPRAETAARAVVQLAASVLPELPINALAPARLVYGADGAAAVAARRLLVTEPRAVGALLAGADMGSFTELADLQRKVWPDGPHWLDPDTIDLLASHGAGQTLIDKADVAKFAIELQGKRLAVVIGTADKRTPLGAFDLYGPTVPAEQLLLYVPWTETLKEQPTELGAPEHLQVWRSLLDRIMNQTAPPRVLATLKPTSDRVELRATVSGCVGVTGGACTAVQGWVVQYHQKAADADFRDAIWTRFAMTQTGPGGGAGGSIEYFGVLPENRPEHAAAFVQVTDIAGTFSRSATSRVVFVGEQYPPE